MAKASKAIYTWVITCRRIKSGLMPLVSAVTARREELDSVQVRGFFSVAVS
jgi:hypothetical protein